jgi:hypothetical protein
MHKIVIGGIILALMSVSRWSFDIHFLQSTLGANIISPISLLKVVEQLAVDPPPVNGGLLTSVTTAARHSSLKIYTSLLESSSLL